MSRAALVDAVVWIADRLIVLYVGLLVWQWLGGWQ